MTHINRSRRLQAGLAGLSVVSALGAAVGLGLTTHTSSSQSSQGTSPGVGAGQRSTSSGEGGGEGDDATRSQPAQRAGGSHRSVQSNPVTPPSNTTPQATTSGS